MINNLKYHDLINLNKTLGESLKTSPKYKVSILSNIIIHQLNDILEYQLRLEGLNIVTSFGNYDNIVQNSAVINNSDCVIIFWELCNIIDGLYYKVELMSSKELFSLEEKIKTDINFVLSNLKNNSTVIFNKFSTTSFKLFALNEAKFTKLCNNLNSFLSKSNYTNLVLINTEKIFIDLSLEKSTDYRFYYSSKSLYTIDFFYQYAEYIKPIVLSKIGKNKKALILDCDNTLWKGVLGEDGHDGITISVEDAQGKIFYEVQYLIKLLARQGIIIGLCSKNNLEDVEYVINNHPDMVLKDEDIAIKKINWNNKAKNISEIATELNIGIDSLVFIDDSSFECNLVKDRLPSVTVIQVSKKLYKYPEQIRRLYSLFYNNSFSEEDLCRNKMYQTEQKREILKKSYNDIGSYLSSLELKIKIVINNKNNISRIAQLTQRTNQFNLTTKRYTETEILNFMKNNKSSVFSFEAIDKYGSYGTVGVCIIYNENKNNSTTVIIDTFLMSCRAIGRKFEFKFINYLVNLLANNNTTIIKTNYIKTLKNKQVINFWDSFNFKLAKQLKKTKKYILEVKNFHDKEINFIEIIN